LAVAGQVAISLHVPVPEVIWTLAVAVVVPLTVPTVQTPAVPVMLGVTAWRAALVAVTVNVDK